MTLNKFTGMNGDGGIYYLDGFSVEKENGLAKASIKSINGLS